MSVILQRHPDRMFALRAFLVGLAGILLIAVLPVEHPAITQGGTLLALCLCLGCALAYGATIRTRPRTRRASFIPLSFTGPTGRFSLHRRGDGRHVEIVAEGVVLAEVTATDSQDEIVVHHSVPADALEELGSALGQAIDSVADADDAHLDWDDHGASADWSDQPGSRSW